MDGDYRACDTDQKCAPNRTASHAEALTEIGGLLIGNSLEHGTWIFEDPVEFKTSDRFREHGTSKCDRHQTLSLSEKDHWWYNYDSFDSNYRWGLIIHLEHRLFGVVNDFQASIVAVVVPSRRQRFNDIMLDRNRVMTSKGKDFHIAKQSSFLDIDGERYLPLY